MSHVREYLGQILFQEFVKRMVACDLREVTKNDNGNFHFFRKQIRYPASFGLIGNDELDVSRGSFFERFEKIVNCEVI